MAVRLVVDAVFDPAQRRGRQLQGHLPGGAGHQGRAAGGLQPGHQLFYVPTNHVCMDYEPFKVRYTAGQPYVGARCCRCIRRTGETNMGNFIAWDGKTGKIVWSNKEQFSVWAGALATAGGVVFYGTLEGYLKAVDAKTGKELYKFKTPSGIIGNVMTYEHGGKQYVAVLSGVGGWAGIGLAAGLEKNKTDVSPGDGYRSLSNYTSLGGTLTVISLQDDNSAGLVLPSRIFAGPGQYPPSFKAYGIEHSRRSILMLRELAMI